MWIKIILVAEIFLTLGEVRSDVRIHSSKACQTTGACSMHRLDECSTNQRIAIMDAYYTGYKDCNTSTCPANFSNIPENTTRTKLPSIQLAFVDESCTSTFNCTSRAQIGPQSQRYSVLKYQCIDGKNEINMCNGDNKTSHDISLKFGQSLKVACTCYITRDTEDPSGLIDFHLLAMNLTSRPCTILNISIGENVQTYDCNTTLTPYRYLANSTLKGDGSRITIENPPTTSGGLWIQINGTNNFTVTCGHNVISTPLPGHSSTNAGTPTQEVPSAVIEPTDNVTDAGADSGAVAAGVIVAVLVIVAVVLALLWFKYKRNQKSKPKHSIEKASDEKYSVATRMPDHNYHEIEAMKPKQPTSNYDYATVTREVQHVGKEGQSSVEDDYAQIGDKRQKVTGHNNTTLLTAKSYNNKSFTENEDDYNHLAANEETKTIENGVHSGGYDTAVSASKSVQKIRNKGVSNDSDYDYNHIDNNPKPNHLQGDYDTTASASKAVANMMDTKEQTEDDYDHFRQTKAGSQATDSPYDTAEHHAEHSGDYSIAGALQKDDPYDGAK